jgi:hypothetical protein
MRRLGLCTPGLATLDPIPSQRLQPAGEMFHSGCVLLDRAVGCHRT